MRIDELLVKKGADVLVGAPETPLNPQTTAAIAEAVATIKGIREAHLPQCFIPGVSEAPAQVLVVVLAASATEQNVMSELGPRLHKIVPKGVYLDVWPLPLRHPVLGSVRKAGCQIYAAPQRPWWRFWQ